MSAVQMANTRDGFAIAIMRVPNRLKSGQTIFSVVRADRKNKSITLSDHNSEPEARKAANKEWLADMGCGPAMIY